MTDKKRVLIVEDDVFLVKAYTIRFEKEGFEVIAVGTAEDVAPLLKKEPPDAVLLDLMLPGTSGFELLEQMKKATAWKDVPVIVVSNLSQESDVQLGKKLGATEYLIKAETKVADVVANVVVHIKK